MQWLKAKPDFCLYTKRIRPGLTEVNRQKQIAFSHHVHNRWGLGKDQNILWTMSDEKWWFGLVSRTFAKMCPALGIHKEVFAVHHKKHIAKVMSIPNTNPNPYPNHHPNPNPNPNPNYFQNPHPNPNPRSWRTQLWGTTLKEIQRMVDRGSS